MDPMTVAFGVFGAICTIIAITFAAIQHGRSSGTSVGEADKRYIAALEQMRRDDLRVLTELRDEVRLNKDEQLSMHRDNKADHDRDIAMIHNDHGELIKIHHDDLQELRAALRGAEGAVNAAVIALDRRRG